MDGGAWWAAVYGVTQSRTRLKRQQQQQQPLSRTSTTKLLTGIKWVFIEFEEKKLICPDRESICGSYKYSKPTWR